MQEVRSWRTRVVKPGRPSEEYLLRKLLCCERCGARMHGTARLATRCAATCAPPAATTAPASSERSKPIPWRSSSSTGCATSNPTTRCASWSSTRSEPSTRHTPATTPSAAASCTDQLERLRDLYVMGDLTKPQYIMRRQALEEELQRTSAADRPRARPRPKRSSKTSRASGTPSQTPPSDASSCLPVRAGLAETTARSSPSSPTTPSPATSPPRRSCRPAPKSRADDAVTKAGATGLEPATSAVTGQRSNLLSYAPAIRGAPG